jgi:ribosome-associated heat shock protein Hsp15
VIRIVELGTRRGPASEAIELYEDLSPPVETRRETAATAREFESRDAGAGRPTKRDRRVTQQLKDTL